MTRHLVQMCNIRVSYPEKEIMLFDGDNSGVFRYATLNPEVVVDYAYSVGQNLCIPTCSVFCDNVSPHD